MTKRKPTRNPYDCRPWERLTPDRIVKEYGPIALLFSTRLEFHRWVKLSPRSVVTVDAVSVGPVPLRLELDPPDQRPPTFPFNSFERKVFDLGDGHYDSIPPDPPKTWIGPHGTPCTYATPPDSGAFDHAAFREQQLREMAAAFGMPGQIFTKHHWSDPPSEENRRPKS